MTVEVAWRACFWKIDFGSIVYPVLKGGEGT
jgi:hypothetical protein